MPNRKPTKTKKPQPKPEPQQGHSPSNIQVSRADSAPLNNLQSPHPEQSHKPQTTQGAVERQPNQEAAKPYRRIDKLNIILTLLFSGVVAIFAGISTYYSSKQWEGIKQSLADARATRNLENRAWVVFKETQNKEPISKTQPTTITVILQNMGATPAVNARVEVTMKYAPQEPETFVTPPDETMRGRYVLPPGKEFPVYVKLPALTDEDYFLLTHGGYKYYLWGIVEYEDIFNETHRTRFCYVWPSIDSTVVNSCVNRQHNSVD